MSKTKCENMKNEKCIVSACLAGIPCRYDCQHKNNKCASELVKDGLAIPLCPEQLAGLPTPREACECKIINGKKVVVSKSGKDYTECFHNGAEIVLNFCKANGIKKAILRKNSPSCGIKTFDGSFTGTLANYPGITAQILMENGIEVISSEDIENPKTPILP